MRPDEHPWIGKVVSARGGNYKNVGKLTLPTMHDYALRIQRCAEELKKAVEECQKLGENELDVVGEERLDDTVRQLERGAGILVDCVKFFSIYKSVAGPVNNHSG